MAKINNENKGNESIPRCLIFDTSLSDRARFVYCYMSAKPEGWDFVLAPMAKELNYSVDTLRKYIAELVSSGWIVKGDQSYDEVTKKFGSVEYTIKNRPSRVGKNPSRQKPDTAKTRDGKNPTQEINSTINSPLNKEEGDNKKVSNETKKEETRFSKPSLEEIKAYIEEKKLLHVDAEEFFNYYELTGWKVGKSMKKMKDWKAACRYWEVKHKEKNKCYEPQPDDDEMVVRFKKWMREKHPEIEFTEVPLTFDGYMRLQREYGMDEVLNQLDYIDANIGKFRQCDIEKSIIQYFERL